MTDREADAEFSDLIAHAGYPEFGSREWFQELWGRAWRAGVKAGWTLRQALRITEGQHLCAFPLDLDGMPKDQTDWDLWMPGKMPYGCLIGDVVPQPEFVEVDW